MPRYLNSDYEFPKEYSYTFAMFWDLLYWKIDWTDINYKPIDLDIKDVKVEFTRGYDQSLVKFDFPAIKEWEIDAYQTVNTWLFPTESDIQLIFKDFDVDFQADLVLDENGYIDPIVYDCDIKFGETYLYHENKLLAFAMHQFVYFGIVIIENTVYFIGDYIFSNMAGPLMDNALNQY